MEVSASSISEYDERKALNILLDAFGSTFSIQEIASAYCEAGRNADLAGEILHDMNQSTSSFTPMFNEEVKDDDENPKAAKLKRRPVSVGTISGVIGKSYARGTASANKFCMATKPLKLDMTNFPLLKCQVKEDNFDSMRDDLMHKDIEDFIFKMLGHGFQLDRGLIREVLDNCGYDIRKGMDKLLDISAATSDEKNCYLSESSQKFIGACPNSGSLPCQGRSEYMTGDRRILNTKEPELRREEGRQNLQKEVLAALFTSPERPEEFPARISKARPVRKSRVAGSLVVEPLKDDEDYKIDDLFSKQVCEEESDGEENDRYQELRQAVKEYRATMKEYYKAAVKAFANGDHARANKLLEQGHFFLSKAREVDEESARKIYETRIDDEMSLDLHDHDAKEAIGVLKSHLSSLSGIPSFKFLKVIIEKIGEENISKGGARKRRIINLLEKHSIKWTEGSNAGIVLIRLDEINPELLSFAQK